MSENLTAIVISAGISLSLLAYSMYQKSEVAAGQVNQLQADNTRQASVIATQSLQFQRFNEIAEQATSQETLITATAQEKEIEYRTILKREKTCDLPVPADVARGLLDYTNSLRAGAMHTDTSGTDKAGAGATTSGTVTYCQAVLWINPLLSAIEQANNQLAGIRQIESDRASIEMGK